MKEVDSLLENENYSVYHFMVFISSTLFLNRVIPSIQKSPNQSYFSNQAGVMVCALYIYMLLSVEPVL